MISIRRLCGFVFLAIAFALAAHPVSATTYYVDPGGSDLNQGTQGAPFASIKKGINTAADGDTVMVAAGNYTGQDNRNLVIDEKDISVIAPAGPTMTTIDCQGVARGFIISITTSATVIQGFKIRNGIDVNPGGTSTGGAIFVAGATPVFRDLIIENCTVQGIHFEESPSDARGGGIYIFDTLTDVLLERVVFNTCSSVGSARLELSATVPAGHGYGGGLALQLAQATLIDCAFNENFAQGGTQDRSSGFGGALSAVDSRLTMTRCTFFNNDARGGVVDFEVGSGGIGGAIYIDSPYETPTFFQHVWTDCRFDSNRVTGGQLGDAIGGALFATAGLHLTLNKPVFIRNKSRGDQNPGRCRSSAIDVQDFASFICNDGLFQAHALSNCDESLSVVCNLSHFSVPGVAVPAVLNRCLFLDNEDSGPVIAATNIALTITNSTFSRNQNLDREFSGIILTASTVAPPNTPITTLEHCTFYSNQSASDLEGNLDGVVNTFATDAGSGVYSNLRVRNSIAAANNPRFTNPHVVSLGNNTTSDASPFTAAAGDQKNTDPLMDPTPSDNGGPTLTHKLLAGSPALNSANPTGGPTVDQRGLPRPAAGPANLPDRGAYEQQPDYTGRPLGDFDSNCDVEVMDFLFLLDWWQQVSPIGGAVLGIEDFLNLLDHWQESGLC